MRRAPAIARLALLLAVVTATSLGARAYRASRALKLKLVPTQDSLFVGDTASARALYVYTPERQSWGMCPAFFSLDTTKLALTPSVGSYGTYTCQPSGTATSPTGKSVQLRAKAAGLVWIYAVTEGGTVDSTSIKVLAGTAPARTSVTASVNKLHAKATVTADQALPALDSITLTTFGSRGQRQPWALTHSALGTWLTIQTDAGYGTSKVRWRRSGWARAVGTYVDTILLTLPGLGSSPLKIIDTLAVQGGATPLQVTAAGGGFVVRTATMAAGSTTLTMDSVLIALTGQGATTATWAASKRRNRTALIVPSMVSSGYVVWQRSSEALKRGVSVDTITVSAAGAAGSPVRILDSLTVTPCSTCGGAPTVAASPTHRRGAAAPKSGTAVRDSALISVSGVTAFDDSAWTVRHRSGAVWLTLDQPSGFGTSEWVRWTRRATTLNVGTYIDTITVALAPTPTGAGALTQVVDTFAVSGSPPPPPADTAVFTVTIAPPTATLAHPSTVQMAATVKNSHDSLLVGRSLIWASSNAGVATVSSTGLVATTGGSAGSTQVSATAQNGVRGLATVTASVPADTLVSRVVITPASISLQPDQTQAFTPQTTNSAGSVLTGRTLRWSTVLTAIATVAVNGSGQGVVTAHGVGTTQVIAATTNGFAADTADITVSLAPPARGLTPRWPRSRSRPTPST
jgi:hypothetical protein